MMSILIIISAINYIESTESENTAGVESLAKLQALSQTLNPKVRYTEDGERCSKIFIQNGKTYYDCTDIRSPDGQDLKKEWCYIENPKAGQPTWGYCREILDWNKIREAAQSAFWKVSQKVTENIRNSQNAVEPIRRLYNDILRLQRQHKTLDNKLLEMNEDYKTILAQKSYLTNLKVQWSQIENDCVFLENEIEKKEAEIEDEKKKKEISEDPYVEQTETHSEITKEYISEREVILGQKINPLIQEQTTEEKTVPSDDDDFEDDELGIGLNVEYFDNLYFKGTPQKEIADEVNLELEGKSPTKEINGDAYSVIYRGFIIPPISSDYTFIIKSDDPSASLMINKRNVMNRNRNKKKESIIKKITKFILSFVGLKKDLEGDGEKDKLYSNKMHLIGGRQYSIIVKYKHDSFSLVNGEKAYIQLLWKSNFFTETQVDQIYLYPTRPKKDLKIIVDPNIGVIKRLYEQDIAFKDSDIFLMQDIPSHYQGLKSIKLNCKKKNQRLFFESNKAANMYVAIPEQGFINPPRGFVETGDYMSLLSIEDNIYDYSNPSKEYPKKIYSTDSFTMKIYQKRINAGKNLINFNYNVKDVNEIVNVKRKRELYGLGGMIVFFGTDPQTSIQKTCGVDSRLISSPEQKTFKSCSASYGSTNCKDGFTTRKANSKWIAKSEESSWIQVEFNGDFEVSKIVYENNNSGNAKNPTVRVQFSNGEERDYSIGNGRVSILNWVVNPPVVTNSVKIIYPNSIMKSGGHYEIYGSKCKIEDENDSNDEDDNDDDDDNNDNYDNVNHKLIYEMSPLFDDPNKDVNEVYSLGCFDDFELRGPLLRFKKQINLKVRVFCQNSCKNNFKDIYGSGEYTTNSVICKSAYHAGIITEEGGLVDIQIGKGLKNYRSETSNGITSKNSQKREFSMKLFKVKSNNSNEKPAGEYKMPKVIRIKFAPINYRLSNTKEFLVDNGLEYGSTSKPFGWSEDMSDNTKKMTTFARRNGGSCPNMLSDTSIDFYPDKKSIWCRATSCKRVYWKAYVGKGEFKFKVYVHDIDQNYIINLQVNGQPLVENTKVKKNCLAEFEGKFTANEKGFLVLTDECKKDCYFAKSKINFVEISKVDDTVDDYGEQLTKQTKLSNKFEQESPDKTAIYKGRCDTGDVIENCLYDDFKTPSAKFCKDPYKLVQVSKDYKSGFQRGKVKCVRKTYLSSSDCYKYCPGPCNNLICNA